MYYKNFGDKKFGYKNLVLPLDLNLSGSPFIICSEYAGLDDQKFFPTLKFCKASVFYYQHMKIK